MKNLTASIAALAVLGFAGAASAQSNPWAPGQTTVPITVTVQEMVELYTSVAPTVALEIVDAGDNQGSAKAVQRTLTHLHNVPVKVSASIDGDIPNNTQFHILIDPVPSWVAMADSGASRTLSWRREGAGTYSAASGGAPNQVSGTGVGNAVEAFTAAVNAPGTGTVRTIQYFADSRNAMAAVGSAGFNVVWTIAKN